PLSVFAPLPLRELRLELLRLLLEAAGRVGDRKVPGVALHLRASHMVAPGMDHDRGEVAVFFLRQDDGRRDRAVIEHPFDLGQTAGDELTDGRGDGDLTAGDVYAHGWSISTGPS